MGCKLLNSEAGERSILRQASFSILGQVGDGSGKLEVFWKELAGSWQKQFVALPVMICLREWVTQKKMGKTRTEIETLLKWFVWSVLTYGRTECENKAKSLQSRIHKRTTKKNEMLPYCDISNPFLLIKKLIINFYLIVTSATPATSAISRWDFLSTLA